MSKIQIKYTFDTEEDANKIEALARAPRYYELLADLQPLICFSEELTDTEIVERAKELFKHYGVDVTDFY